ncbi:hypothetical protein SLE2022_151340 [Rubroshorea leprosula]
MHSASGRKAFLLAVVEIVIQLSMDKANVSSSFCFLLTGGKTLQCLPRQQMMDEGLYRWRVPVGTHTQTG